MSEQESKEILPAVEEDDDLMVTIVLDNDEELDCEVLTIFEAGEREYIVLQPVGDDNEPVDISSVYIYRYSEDEDGTPLLDNIHDEEELELVSWAFDQLQAEALADEE